MAANYTDDQVQYMVDKYTANPNRKTVDKLAEKLNKSIKSIIGKLSREGVYQKAIYKTKTGEIPMTKGEIIVQVAELLDADYNRLAGLEKSPKQDLKYLHDLVRGLST
tara:strand:- start:68 stop:391 length:324 start_codon:yes stop_codon:yes gene_type:complete